MKIPVAFSKKGATNFRKYFRRVTGRWPKNLTAWFDDIHYFHYDGDEVSAIIEIAGYYTKSGNVCTIDLETDDFEYVNAEDDD